MPRREQALVLSVLVVCPKCGSSRRIPPKLNMRPGQHFWIRHGLLCHECNRLRKRWRYDGEVVSVTNYPSPEQAVVSAIQSGEIKVRFVLHDGKVCGVTLLSEVWNGYSNRYSS